MDSVMYAFYLLWNVSMYTSVQMEAAFYTIQFLLEDIVHTYQSVPYAYHTQYYTLKFEAEVSSLRTAFKSIFRNYCYQNQY